MVRPRCCSCMARVGTRTTSFPWEKPSHPNQRLLSPRGKVLENGMPRFFRRLALGVFDEKDLKFRSHELASFITDAASSYNLDADKIFAVGYSNGANIAASILLLNSGLLKGAVLFHPMVPLVPEVLPDLSTLPIFIGAAWHDEIVPPEETERLATLLRNCGADVTLHWEPGGHALSPGEVEGGRRWLARYL